MTQTSTTRAGRRPAPRLPTLTLLSLALLGGCAGLPSGGGPVQPGEQPEVPGSFGGGRANPLSMHSVRFEVTCDHCRVAWVHPGARDSRELMGPWEKRSAFQRRANANTVSLDLRPLTEGSEIQFARIYLNGVVRAEHRGQPGEPALHVRLAVPLGDFGGAGP